MESSCDLNVLEVDMNNLSDLLLKNTDPALSCLDIDEESTDIMQLMCYQNDDLLSSVSETEKYTIPLVTIPNVRSIVVDNVICPEFIIDAENSSISRDQIFIQTIQLDNIGETPPTTVSEDVLVQDEEDLETDNTVFSLSNVETNLEESIMIQESKDDSEETSESIEDTKDEITEALLSLGITKDYFIKTSGGQNNKKQQLWSCPLLKCNFNTMKLDTFKIHLLKHFGKRPFKCKHLVDGLSPCRWAFFSKSKLQRHKNVHCKEKVWFCSYDGCQKMFSSKAYLKCHMVKHEKVQKHHCPVASCNEIFNTKTQCHAHMRAHTEVPAMHMCEYTGCEKRFYSLAALQSHIRVHMKDPVDLKCHLCDRSFKAPCRLKAHFHEVHEGMRKYKCSFQGCKWAFVTNSKLTRHMNTHLNIKRFTCSIPNCGKSYLRPEHLHEHSNTHLENRLKFTCPYSNCKLSFSAKSSLYAHLKHVHSNGRN